MEPLIIQTTVSDDYFQHYIPLFCYTASKAYPEHKINITVAGKISDITRNALWEMFHLPNSNSITIMEKPKLKEIPRKDSTINLMRFLYAEPCEETIITDIDFLVFRSSPTLKAWHVQKMNEMKTCYAGHHGPYKKPKRFPDSWTGDKERIAGGYVYLTREWFDATADARNKYRQLLEKGELAGYREEDEVVLCNIIKESGLPVPKDKAYPLELRGIHLGDFKDTMAHRWTNVEKMLGKVSEQCLYKYKEMDTYDTVWERVRDIVMQDETINQIFKNLNQHISERKIRW